MIEVREYVDVRGHNHYSRWLLSLDMSSQFRIAAAVVRLGDGNFSAVKPEGKGISALRLNFGPGYRIYFGQDGKEIVILLAGGTKNRQQDDIDLAQRLWAEYKRTTREK